MILNVITANITMTANIWKKSLLLMTWFCYLFEEWATFAGLEIVSSIQDKTCQDALYPFQRDLGHTVPYFFFHLVFMYLDLKLK